VVLEAGGQILMEILGINDIIDCLKGDIGACVMAVVGALPWGKIFKAKKIAEALWKAGKAIFKFFEELKWAKAILKGAQEAAERAKAAAAAAAKAAAEKAAAAKAAAERAAKKAAEEAAARAKAKAAKAKAATKKGSGKSDEAGRSCRRHSFVAGTAVLLADGTRKPIEETEPGDTVLATDPITGQTEARQVTRTIRTEDDKHFVDLTIRDRDTGKDQTVTTTAHHPFWSATQGRWVDAGKLQTGELLRTSAGTYVQITAIRTYQSDQVTYDLTVDITHAYYVAAGETAVLVHNCDDDIDFAHGTTADHADNIAENGLSGDAARAASHGGSVGRPGSLFTYRVSGPGDPNLNIAAQWGVTRNGGVREGAAVGIFRMCRCTYDRLVREGHITTRVTGEGMPEEVIFGPGALPFLRHVTNLRL
jgi:Pretoxin HINT domain